MNIAETEEFNPEKLRARLEALYISLAMTVFGVWKHIARLRSWRETRRTSILLAAYITASIFDRIVPALLASLMIMILLPAARKLAFPPAPASLIDGKTGGVQKPMAGVLASLDSMTGAPEKHPGEAVEQEAHSFVNSVCIVSTFVSPFLPPAITSNVYPQRSWPAAWQADRTQKARAPENRFAL